MLVQFYMGVTHQLMEFWRANLNLIDEYQLCVQPVAVGSGLPLFENINNKTTFKFIKIKIFSDGAVTLYYEPLR